MFDRRLIRCILPDNIVDLRIKIRQTDRQIACPGRAGAVRNMPEAAIHRIDDAPTSAPEAWIETDYPHFEPCLLCASLTVFSYLGRTMNKIYHERKEIV
jgi:hypothetical protein